MARTRAAGPVILANKPDFLWFLEPFELDVRVATEPAKFVEALASADVVIFGDAHRRTFDAHGLELFAARIRDGRSLLYFGGWESFGAGGYADSPLALVLPVEIQPNDVRYVPHRTRGVATHDLSREVGSGLDFSGMPLSTSYNLPAGVKEGASVVLSRDFSDVDPGSPFDPVPLVVYWERERFRCLSVSLCLAGGGAKDLNLWEGFPRFLVRAVQDLCPDQLRLPAHPAETPFLTFLDRFRRADHASLDYVIRQQLGRPWSADFVGDQYRLIGDLAGSARSPLAVTARQLQLPYLLDNPIQYSQREVETYKYKARAAANSLRFSEASSFYEIAAVAQGDLEAGQGRMGRTVPAWSHYFGGMASLLRSLNALTDRDMVVVLASEDELREALRRFDRPGSEVPWHKRQAEILARAFAFILEVARERARVATALRRTLRRVPVVGTKCTEYQLRDEARRIREGLTQFRSTYDEIPALTNGDFISTVESLVLASAESRSSAARDLLRRVERSSDGTPLWLIAENLAKAHVASVERGSFMGLVASSLRFLQRAQEVTIALILVFAFGAMRELWIRAPDAIHDIGAWISTAGFFVLLALLVARIFSRSGRPPRSRGQANTPDS